MKPVFEFLALRRSIFGLLIVVVLVGMGEKMPERFLPLYLLALGGGELAVGILGGLHNLLGALYSFPAGYLSQRLGTRAALLVFNLMSISGYLLVVWVPRWEMVLLGALLFLTWSAVSLPATMNLVAQVLPRSRRTMGVSMHSLVRRIPMAIGPVLGGWFIARWGTIDGMRFAFIAAAVMAVVAIVFQQILIEPDRAPALGSPLPRNPVAVFREMSPALRNLLASDILIRFCEQIPNAFVVIWCTRVIRSPVTEVQFGVLSAIEMIVAAVCYIPVAYFADRGEKKPFVLATFGFFTAFPLVLFLSHSFWPLVVAFVIRGLKEFGDPTRKALILDLAPDDRKALMFGLYYFVRDSIVAIAAFGGYLVWEISPQANLWTAFAFGLLGSIWFAAYGRSTPAPQDHSQAAARPDS